MFDSQTSRCLFGKKLLIYKISYEIKLRDVQYYARNFAKSSFSDVTKGQIAGLPIFYQMKGIVEQGSDHLLIISNSSHFFNKTDSEQYLLRNFVLKEIQYISTTNFVYQLAKRAL